MRPQDIIARKRDGNALTKAEIDAFIDGVCDGSWADYQISAMVMAMFVRGLEPAEQDAVTYAMLHSGELLDLSAIDKPKADKHSTGGVGDKTSLIIAPVVAACGVAVPMISGRGLGHTGGTLDKLEAIPGYRVDLATDEFKSVLAKCGYAMVGQTDDIAPADKKLYALRDATATVPYIPLIVASIMSKKLAEGLDALVLDVKTGSGAFMTSLEDSVRLAEAMVQTGKNFGVRTQAVVSDMDRPLGRFVGNACEVHECVRILKNDTPEGAEETRELSLELAARMLELSGVVDGLDDARKSVEDALASGRAFELFRQNCELQGGDTSVLDKPETLLSDGLHQTTITAERDGYVSAVTALAIGEAVVRIGGGREKAEDSVDHAVGFECVARIGDEVRTGDTLGVLITRDAAAAASVTAMLNDAYEISEEPPANIELIRAVI